jgi:hypothetical protein
MYAYATNDPQFCKIFLWVYFAGCKVHSGGNELDRSARGVEKAHLGRTNHISVANSVEILLNLVESDIGLVGKISI